MNEAMNKSFEAYWRHLTRYEGGPAVGDEARKQAAHHAYQDAWEEAIIWSREQATT